ncbi:hypothetical protein [Salinicola avicenniae]|uniref:hypothetical protein n=1 Tax=Salinicola avicenniae TaxID=2916836 RepID=UPI002072B9E4|nr:MULTISPECIES: hypothetical protein [unclassified Salinicola]
MNRVRAFILCSLLLVTIPATADIAIVVSKESGISQISRDDAVNIFMGRYRKLTNGHLALPVDLTPLKTRFYRVLVNRDVATINSYWARLVFSGEASPPQQIATPLEMRDLVMHNANTLGYMDSDEVNDDIHVVLTLHE